MSETKEFKPLDVGASERIPWKLAKGLAKNIAFKEDGSLEVGKNLEVDGTTKMNGGFADIHEYEIDNHHSLHIVAEKGVYFLGGVEEYESKDSEYRTHDYPLAIGCYLLNDGKVVRIAYLTFPDPQDGSVISHYVDLNSDELVETTIPTSNGFKTIFGNQSLVGRGNIDLYRHKLIVQDKDGTTPFVVYYTSSSNLKCDSVQDLRTLLKVGDIPVTLYGNLHTDFSPAAMVVSSSACTIKTSATASISVTAVSDTVTTI